MKWHHSGTCGKCEVLQTHPDMDDGFGGFTPSCREYSRPRQDAVLTVLGAIPARTVIGPVLQFAVVKFMGTYGI